MPVKTRPAPEKLLAMKEEVEKELDAIVVKYVGVDPKEKKIENDLKEMGGKQFETDQGAGEHAKHARMDLNFDEYGRLDSASVSVYAPSKYGNGYGWALLARVDLDTVDVSIPKAGKRSKWASEEKHSRWLTRPKAGEFNISLEGYNLRIRRSEGDVEKEDEYRKDIKKLRREEKNANDEMLNEVEGVFEKGLRTVRAEDS